MRILSKPKESSATDAQASPDGPPLVTVQSIKEIAIADTYYYLISNIPASAQAVDDYRAASRLSKLTFAQFSDLIEDVKEEMIRRKTQKTSILPHRDGLSEIRKLGREKLSKLLLFRFERLCFDICCEIVRRHRPILEKVDRKNHLISHRNMMVLRSHKSTNKNSVGIFSSMPIRRRVLLVANAADWDFSDSDESESPDISEGSDDSGSEHALFDTDSSKIEPFLSPMIEDVPPSGQISAQEGPSDNSSEPTPENDSPDIQQKLLEEVAYPEIMENQKLAEVCEKLLDIFRNRSKYKFLLSYRDEEAQSILNLSQALLYTPSIGSRLKNELVVAIQRLSEKSALYPECFTLQDVVLEGDYPISAGQFGEVWKGIFSQQSVSLKVVKAYRHSHIQGLLRAFSREAVLWGQLSHENVLPFYGIFRLGGAHNRICLVSPWMENGDISDFLTQNPSANRTLLISDIAFGIGYIHQNNIIHGDLKGANILVTSDQRACLADFGLSTIRDPEVLGMTSRSSVGHTGGTVRWMAPELLDPVHERRNSKESDIYAFSCVCYEIFTGHVPFYEIFRDQTVILKVNQGERPSRPAKDSSPFIEWGLTASMWRLMEDCWNQEISDRPHARNILRRLPTIDTHPRDPTSSGYISPSLFRTAAGADLDKYLLDSRILRLLDVDTTSLH